MLAVASANGDGPDSSPEDDEHGDGPIVSVYDLESADLKCVFAEPADGDRRRRFVSVRFLYDNVFAAALAVDPGGYGGTVYYYSWRNSTVETCVRVDDGHVADVSVGTLCARDPFENQKFSHQNVPRTLRNSFQ